MDGVLSFLCVLRRTMLLPKSRQLSPHYCGLQEALVDNNWAEIADHIETIEELYEVSARPNT